MNVVLISTYDLGHQPFGLASPAAWLRARGHAVCPVDMSINALPSLLIREADVVAFYLPMHTATRLAAEALPKVRLLNPKARLLTFGLYAAINAEYLRELGVDASIGGEFESALCAAVEGGSQSGGLVQLERLRFLVPDRTGLPSLGRYAKLRLDGVSRQVGYTEASRGCKHLCRHCPIVPVYNGVFRVIPREVVLEDIRRQVAAGAEHITFGDPDFFNGPGHAMKLVRELHREFPGLTYDATIKVEHLLEQRRYLRELRETGCLFVTSAVESVDDAVLERLDKGHTRQDFLNVVELCRDAELTLSPTFIPFTPWVTLTGYRDLLRVIFETGLTEAVSPVQLALRLLIPPGSRLLELAEMQAHVTALDKAALLYRWKHEDPAMDTLASSVLQTVNQLQKERLSRGAIFRKVWELAHGAAPVEPLDLLPRAAIPYLDEPWYC